MLKLAMSLLALSACAADGGPSGGDDDVPGDDAPPFTDGVSTLSGHGEAAYIDGKRGVARFSNPVGAAYGPDGMLYVADFDNSKIRIVDPDDGNTRTLIDQPEFRRPFAMAFAADGTLYVTTDCNSTSGQQGPMTGTIWRVDDGVASVVAENIGRPRGLAILPDGRLAIADWQHHVVQLVNASTGAVTKLAGTWDAPGMVEGAAAQFSTPYGIAVLDGKLVVADFDNMRLRSVSLDGTVSTLAGAGVAGYGDGAAASAKLSRPQGIAVANGIVYFTDLGNFRVRRVRDGNVETVAGTGEGGFLDHDDPLSAQLFGLEGLAVQPDGARVYVPDGSRGDDIPYNRIRRIEIH
jgi:DNA-binding beta-propeller fold protein YncE